MITLVATCAFGLEALVADELRALGYADLRVDRGKVTWSTDPLAICRANLWLRCADRVLLELGSFRATTFDELFDQTTALPWSDWIPADAQFPVIGKSVKSTLSSVPACQSIVKKAIVNALQRGHGVGTLPETGPRHRIQVALLNEVVSLTLDTSGDGLHKRGYRDLSAPAPLRETLAAAMVTLSHWQPDFILADPCCGSGTIPIEAAMIGRKIAPGTLRTFDAFRWPAIPRELWGNALDEADELALHNRKLRIWGSDISPEAIRLAEHHADRAGFGGEIEFIQRPLAEFRTHHKYGYLVCNPPYGERLGDVQQAEELYAQLKGVLDGLRDWSMFVLTPHAELERIVGRQATHRRRLYNGRIKCIYYQFFGPKPPGTGD